MFDVGVVGPVVDALSGLPAGGDRSNGYWHRLYRTCVGTPRRRVNGIDLSRAMVARLRAKPGRAAVDVTIGDFASTRAPGEFSLVHLVSNTIYNLTTQDSRVASINAAGHLEPGGSFVSEVAASPP
ncbi:hypothetical protein LAUMK35_01411 [Mycobacterium pseudokansasii]|nr:hypothetical protein LAUMK35_01411 [Mycobacterium pseudokansasii]VAZ91776.1 hypothetical protein LAUMK21_01411 [Mycobacterium pseudokansasii]